MLPVSNSSPGRVSWSEPIVSLLIVQHSIIYSRGPNALIFHDSPTVVTPVVPALPSHLEG